MGAKTILVFAIVVGTLYLSRPSPRLTNSSSDPDSLLVTYPLSDKWTLKSGKTVPTPYHSFDGDGKILLGYFPVPKAQQFLKESGADKHLQVVTTTDGRAVALIWCMKYTDTGIGPYQELVVSFLTSRRDSGIKQIGCDSQSSDLCAAIGLTTHGVLNYAYRLWLDSDIAIEYGREILGTDKYKAAIKTSPTSFEVDKVFKGEFQPTSIPGVLTSVVDLIKAAGVRGFLQAVGSPITESFLACPPGIATLNPTTIPVSRGLFHNHAGVTVRPVTAEDKIELKGDLAKMEFEARALQHNPAVRFYLGNPANPESPPASKKKN